MINWTFENYPEMDVMESSTMTINKASTRVMEKCGMDYLRIEQEKWKKFDEPVELAA